MDVGGTEGGKEMFKGQTVTLRSHILLSPDNNRASCRAVLQPESLIQSRSNNKLLSQIFVKRKVWIFLGHNILSIAQLAMKKILKVCPAFAVEGFLSLRLLHCFQEVLLSPTWSPRSTLTSPKGTLANWNKRQGLKTDKEGGMVRRGSVEEKSAGLDYPHSPHTTSVPFLSYPGNWGRERRNMESACCQFIAPWDDHHRVQS